MGADMSRRVVVTGMGAITPIGLSVEEFWAAVKSGKTGFAPITKFDASEYKCKLAAEVKDFDPKNYMDFKAAKRMEAFCSLRWRHPRKRLGMRDWICSRRIPGAWAWLSAPASAPSRRWSASTASCWRKDLTV